MKKYLSIAAPLLLSGCLGTGLNFTLPGQPSVWSAYQSDVIEKAEAENLHKWWQKFKDPALDTLVETAFATSPARRIAEARIIEARGIRRSTSSSLFPQIGASANSGRQKTGLSTADNYYEATFDASYEVDLFGQNRNTKKAADENVKNLEANYNNVTLSLIAEISRDYIDYRRFQKQAFIAQKNLDIQEKTLSLVRHQKEFGEAPQLDVERAENLVNTTKASIPEFMRLADNARLRLSVLTGEVPEKLIPILSAEASIPGADATPVLLAPADVIALRPDIQAAAANLRASTALSKAAVANIFPKFNISGFFGVAEGALFSATSLWNVAAGAAVSLLDFGRIQGGIDAARGVEMRAFESYRLTTLQAVSEVETALTDFARLNEQEAHLHGAYDNANKALELSQLLYREGEVDFINVLDAQRTLNTANASLINIEGDKAQSLVRLYKSLGVY